MKILQSLEWAFRHIVVYPLFRLFFKNPPHDQPIDLSGIKKILILRYDRIGDMIVTTPIIRKLKRENPALQIGVFTSPLNAEIIRFHPAVDKIFVLERNWLSLLREILRARRERYEVVLNFVFNRTTSGALLANLIAPKGIKVGQGAEKYRFYFNKQLSLPRRSLHMVEILAYYAGEVFGIEFGKEELGFDIAIDEGSRQSVDEFLRSCGIRRGGEAKGKGDEYLVLNLSATDSERRISFEQSVALVRFLAGEKALPTVLICSPNDSGLADNVAKRAGQEKCYVFPRKGIATLREIASLIEGAICVFTPDTSIIHFAAALRTPVLGFFTPLQDVGEWLPFGVAYSAVTAENGKPVSSIPVETLRESSDKFLSTHVFAKKKNSAHV